MKKNILVYFNILLILSINYQPLFAQSPQVGDNFQGGIVFYVDTTGGQISGLVAAPGNQPGNPNTGINWGCYGWGTPGADGTAIGTGAQNTIDIEAFCSSLGIAADICANLTLGGYSDWFLPSKDELKEMYLNRSAIGGFANNNYWSSSQSNINYALMLECIKGTNFEATKSNYGYVRAVRAF